MTDTPKSENKTRVFLVVAGLVVLLSITVINAFRTTPDPEPIVLDPRQRVSDRDSAEPLSGDPLASVLDQLRGSRPAQRDTNTPYPSTTPSPSPVAPAGPKRYGLAGVDHTVSADPSPYAQSPPLASVGSAFSTSSTAPDFLSIALDRLGQAGALPGLGQPPNNASNANQQEAVAYTGFRAAPQGPALIAGTVMSARVDVATHSDYAAGVWRGLVTRNVLDITGTQVLIPAGSRILGKPFAASSQNEILNERLGLGVTLIVRPDGSEIHLPGGVALDDQGIPAISGDVNRHVWKRVAGFAAYALLGVAPGLLLENGEARSSQDRALRDLTSSTTRAAQSLVQPYLSLVPTIQVPAGTAIHIVFTQSIEVPPYG